MEELYVRDDEDKEVVSYLVSFVENMLLISRGFYVFKG